MNLTLQLQQSNKRAKRQPPLILKALAVAICLASGGLANLSAQESWYKVELSIFSNESLIDREQERWQADRNTLDYPNDMTRLKVLSDVLLIDSLLPEPVTVQSELTNSNAQTDGLALAIQEDTILAEQVSDQELRAEAIGKVGPFPIQSGAPFKFMDFERDGYLRLPANLSDFAQTNRALDRSPEHRLLFHAVWHQAVGFENEAKAIVIEGGERFGNQPELQGNLTIHFNENADRVVLAADIWLTEFVIDEGRSLSETGFSAAAVERPLESTTDSPTASLQWTLPELPTTISDGPLQRLQNLKQTDSSLYGVQNVFHMLQNRAMRSNEFHYMDHPALGIVVQVEPYEVPALPVIEEAIDLNLESSGAFESELGAAPVDTLNNSIIVD